MGVGTGKDLPKAVHMEARDGSVASGATPELSPGTEATAAVPIRVAFLGLGRMGTPMAARLVEAGFPVVGYDPAGSALARAAQRGVRPAETALAAVEDADVLVTMLPDAAAVEDVAWRTGIVESWPTGRIWLEMSSSRPETSRRLAVALAERGGELLDAPVTGGVRGAESGTLTVIAGGSAELTARCRPLLDAMSSKVVRVGDEPGAGDLAKSLNNMLSAVNLTAASEALAMAVRGGLDLRNFVDAVSSGTGGSHAIQVKVGSYVLEGRLDAGFTIGQYLKDLAIALEVIKDAEIDAPLATQTFTIWQEIGRARTPGADHTEVVVHRLERNGLVAR